jgi:hypothetical protein
LLRPEPSGIHLRGKQQEADHWGRRSLFPPPNQNHAHREDASDP